MQSYLLDTHAWIWMQQADAKLSKDSVARIESAQAERCLYGSVISVFEIALLEARGRIHLNSNIHSWLEESFADEGIQLLPLTPEIAIASTRLPGTIHGDPADRILLATARIHNLTLLTRDKHLLAYGRKEHVRTQRI